MMRIAKFKKVSYKQFKKDVIKHFGNDIKGNIKEIYDNIKLPRRATCGSAGYDFYLPFDISLNKNETVTIPTGIKCSMCDEWFLGILPRSGHGFKHGLRVINTMGVIDSDYIDSDNEGHIMIKLINDSSIANPIDFESGTAIAQGIFIPYGITVNDDTDELRNGGFGSTDEN